MYCIWPYCVRTEGCCAVGALFSLRSSLQRATGGSKWVLTRGIPDACSTEPRLARRSQQWANIHPRSRNHFDFSAVDPRGCSYDLQGCRGTTVACLDHVSWRDEEVWLLCSFQRRENICSVLDDFMVKLQLQVVEENASTFSFKLALLLAHTSSGDLKGNRCKHSLCVSPLF